MLVLFLKGNDKSAVCTGIFTLTPGSVVLRNYFAQFDAFEFQFTVSSEAVEVTAWGKDSARSLDSIWSLDGNPEGNGVDRANPYSLCWS